MANHHDPMKLIRPTWGDIRHVALRARYAELLRLREFVKRIEDSTAGGADIKLDERVSPMPPGARRVPCATRRRRPNLQRLHGALDRRHHWPWPRSPARKSHSLKCAPPAFVAS